MKNDNNKAIIPAWDTQYISFDGKRSVPIPSDYKYQQKVRQEAVMHKTDCKVYKLENGRYKRKPLGMKHEKERIKQALAKFDVEEEI